MQRKDIESRFRAIGTRRAAEGVGLHQFVWALITSRDHLWHLLQREAFACNVVELYGELELHQMLTQFFLALSIRLMARVVNGGESVSRRFSCCRSGTQAL